MRTVTLLLGPESHLRKHGHLGQTDFPQPRLSLPTAGPISSISLLHPFLTIQRPPSSLLSSILFSSWEQWAAADSFQKSTGRKW